MTIRPRDITILSLLTIVAFGAIAFAGWWHPNAPDTSMQMYLPQITLPTVIIAGLVDGINPCAFTVLLLFITTLTTTLKIGEQNITPLRARLLPRQVFDLPPSWPLLYHSAPPRRKALGAALHGARAPQDARQHHHGRQQGAIERFKGDARGGVELLLHGRLRG